MTPSKPSLPSDPLACRRALRRQLLTERRQLDEREQQQSAMKLFRRVLRWPRFHQARRLAFYLPAGGEIDPRPLLQHCLGSGALCCLPTLSPLHEGKMYFVPVKKGTALLHNRWGIAEPLPHRVLSPRALDIVFVPLVGFDSDGNRLGMGKGFYDRRFAFRGQRTPEDRPAHGRPILAGLAHDCQRVDRISAEPWDIRLDVIFTPGSTFDPSNRVLSG